VPPPDRSTYPLAAGRLGASALVFFALAAATPLTVVTTVIPAAYARGDGSFVPLAFLALGVVLLLFCAGYAAMARRSPNAGALYAFVARGLGRPIGIGAAWVALISYNAVQIGLYGLVGLAAAPLLDSWFGMTAPWWTVAAAAGVVVAACGLFRVEIAGGVLALLVLAEAAVITGFSAANLLEPAAGAVTLDTIVPADWAGIDRPALGLLLAAAAFAFVGFETTAAYGEEAIRPRRAVGRSAYASVVVMTLLYVLSSWTTSLAAGPGRVSGLAAGRGSELLFDLAAARLAPWAVTLGRVLLLTGLVAAMISLHHTVARYTFALGRERLLPSWLGRTGRRSAVPHAASLAQTVVAGAVIGGAVALGVDPQAELFPWLVTGGALGVLLLLLATSLAALLFLNRAPNGENAVARLVAPGLATIGLGTLVYLAAINLPELLGVPSDALLVLIVPGVFAAAVLLGLSYGLALRFALPVVYAGIGLGGAAVVVTPAVPHQRTPGAHRPERVRK
jgi:amino acid transporter